MKIVIVNGSPRKNGATAKVLEEFARQLRMCGDIDVAAYQISDLRMEFCKGCCACYKTGRCFIDDDVEMLSQAIAEADGLVIGAPCYASNVPGQLKTLIDRGHFVFEQLLKDKYCVGVVTYENAEGGSAFKVIKKLFLFSGAKTADKLIIKTPFNSDPVSDERVAQKIKREAIRLGLTIRQGSRYPIINRLLHFFVLNIGIKPFVAKKGKAYQGIIQHWDKRGISHGGV